MKTKMHKLRVALIIIFTNLLISSSIYAQVAVNETGNSPDASAIFDAQSTSKGMLIPRMTTAQRNAITSPAQSLLIYNTTTKCLEVWENVQWNSIWCASCPVPSSVSATATPNPICESQTLSLNGSATGATNWLWGGPNGFSSTLQNPTITNITTLSAGVYTLTATNSCGSATPVNTASVTVNSLPTTVTVSGGGTFCNNATLTASGGTGGTIYWQGTTSGGTSTANSTNPQTVSSSGTYYFRAYNSCGWGTEGSATITITTLPTAVTVSGGGTFCNNATLTASGGTGGTIYWQGTTSGGTSTATPSTSQVVSSSGTYYFRAYNSCGWGTEGSASVTINSAPNAPLAGTNVPSSNQIIWNWNTSAGATAYYYNTVNNFSTATSNGASTTYTQTSLSPNTTYTLYVWAYNSCGNSNVTVLTSTTTGKLIYSTHGTYTWTVPSGTTSLTVKAWGGGGATGGQANGGGGGYATRTFGVSAGQTVTIIVGGAGTQGTGGIGAPAGGAGGYGGGGKGGDGWPTATINWVNAGGGGGRSEISIGGPVYIVAGGGGGGGGNSRHGGGGGGNTGLTATNGTGCLPDATGGTQAAGGTGGGTGGCCCGSVGSNGAANTGGIGGNATGQDGAPGGGGGGGYYGGGGGGGGIGGQWGAGAGGGSSYVPTGSTIAGTNDGLAGNETDSDWISPAGRQNVDGLVVLIYN